MHPSQASPKDAGPPMLPAVACCRTEPVPLEPDAAFAKRGPCSVLSAGQLEAKVGRGILLLPDPHLAGPGTYDPYYSHLGLPLHWITVARPRGLVSADVPEGRRSWRVGLQTQGGPVGH